MYSYQELANFAGVDRSTLFRWVSRYKKAGVWRKTSPGRLMNRRDAESLAQLAGFDLPPVKKINTIERSRKLG